VSRSVDCRDVLKAVGASLLLGGPGLLGVPGTASSADAAAGTRWTCTNQDCDPFIYDPALGAENIVDPDHPIPPPALPSRTCPTTGCARCAATPRATSCPSAG